MQLRTETFKLHQEYEGSRTRLPGGQQQLRGWKLLQRQVRKRIKRQRPLSLRVGNLQPDPRSYLTCDALPVASVVWCQGRPKGSIERLWDVCMRRCLPDVGSGQEEVSRAIHQMRRIGRHTNEPKYRLQSSHLCFVVV
eukprot:1381533-Amphidinium_carterae.1